jgi:uncharacterized membrane protein YphA (DoxX/SURF4 family)
MNILIWIVSALVAIAFIAAGVMKLSQLKEKLATQMPWVNDVSASNVHIIGLLELLGGLGLVLPRLLNILPWLSVLAAIGLILDMIVAALLHIRRKESFVPNIVLGVLTAVTLLSTSASQIVNSGSPVSPP